MSRVAKFTDADANPKAQISSISTTMRFGPTCSPHSMPCALPPESNRQFFFHVGK